MPESALRYMNMVLPLLLHVAGRVSERGRERLLLLLLMLLLVCHTCSCSEAGLCGLVRLSLSLRCVAGRVEAWAAFEARPLCGEWMFKESNVKPKAEMHRRMASVSFETQGKVYAGLQASQVVIVGSLARVVGPQGRARRPSSDQHVESGNRHC